MGGSKCRDLSTSLRHGRDDRVGMRLGRDDTVRRRWGGEIRALREFEVEVIGESGGADAGSTVESFDFETGIVGEDEEAGDGEGVGDGFEVGVALEGGGVFDGLRYVGEVGKGQHCDTGSVRAAGELCQFAGIGGGGVERHGSKLHREGSRHQTSRELVELCALDDGKVRWRWLV
jgi:hypothetical protein